MSKPLVNVGLVKLVQDHFASPDCTPMTPRCVFPQKFEAPLAHAIRVLDQRRGTWKSAMKIKHIAQITQRLPADLVHRLPLLPVVRVSGGGEEERKKQRAWASHANAFLRMTMPAERNSVGRDL